MPVAIDEVVTELDDGAETSGRPLPLSEAELQHIAKLVAEIVANASPLDEVAELAADLASERVLQHLRDSAHVD